MGATPYARASGAGSGTKHRPRPDRVQRLNDHHGDDLVLVARTLCAHTDAIAARAERVDRHGIDPRIDTPGAAATRRVACPEPATDETPAAARSAMRTSAHHARDTPRPDADDSSAS